LGVDYDQLAERTLKGGSDEEILEWCFENGKRPNDEEIKIWNSFILKRGWPDSGSEELQSEKEKAGLGDGDDIPSPLSGQRRNKPPLLSVDRFHLRHLT